MKSGNILALDYGTKRIGLATGSFEMKMAFPKGFILNKGLDYVFTELLSFCEEWDIGTIVVGLPLDMKSVEDNEMTTKVRYFVSKLKKALPETEVSLFDERLTTFEANELIDQHPEIFKERSMHKDEIAAQIILQRFFDSHA